LDRVSTEIGATTNEYDIHFGHQKSPVFLLDESGSRAAAFFASSSDASRLIKMQGTHRQRVQNHKKDAKRLQAEIESLDGKLHALSPVDEIAAQVAAAETTGKKLNDDQARIARLKTSITQIRNSQNEQTRWAKVLSTCQQIDSTSITPESLAQSANRCKRLQSVIEAAERAVIARDQGIAVGKALVLLRSVAEPLPIKPLSELITRLASNYRQLRQATAIRNGCADLRPIPEMQPADRCRQLIGKLTESQSACQRNLRVTQAVGRLAEPSPPTSVLNLSGLIERLRQAELACRKNSARFEAFKELPTVATPYETLPLKKTIQGFLPLLKAVESASIIAAEAEAKLKDQESQIREFVNQDPTCQTCGGKIDPETLMSTLPDLHQHSSVSEAKA
jgi:exonuclease SbcC